jgi:hypothetical protein
MSRPGMVESTRLQAKHIHDFRPATCYHSFVILRLDRRIQEIVLPVLLDPAIKSQDDIL